MGAIVAVVGVALVVAIPFATNGRVGILGQGLINDDMASHLLFTEWVDSRDGPTPDLVKDGYPLGPHAVVAATAKVSGAGLIEAFAGLTGAIAVLTALTAYGALGGVRELLRAPAAVLGAMSYLFAAYLAQGAFKEPMLGLALLGFALSLPALQRTWDGRQPTLVSTLPDRGRGWLRTTALAGIPAGVIAAGTIYNYSFPGLAWLILAAAVWGLLIAWRERPERHGEWQLRNRLRWARPALAVTVGITGAGAADRDRQPRPVRQLRGLQPLGRGRQHRLRQPAPAAQPARGARDLALERVPDRARRTPPPPRSPSGSAACSASPPSPGAWDGRSPGARRRFRPPSPPARLATWRRSPSAPPTPRQSRWRSLPRW